MAMVAWSGLSPLVSIVPLGASFAALGSSTIVAPEALVRIWSAAAVSAVAGIEMLTRRPCLIVTSAAGPLLVVGICGSLL